jgi:Spy/CpxP family protein refolding chaperone
MRTKWAVAVLAAAFGGAVSFAQDKPKEAKPAEKQEGKAKGQLPANWKNLGLTDEQTQKVYKLQAKYGDDIDKLEEQIKALKEKMNKERLAVLTTEQKKRLEDILKEKAGTDKKDK